MKVNLQITRDGAPLLANVYDVTDAPVLDCLAGAQLSLVRV